MKFLGFVVQAKAKDSDGRFKDVSPKYQTQSAAITYEELYRKQHPDMETLVVKKTRGEE